MSACTLSPSALPQSHDGTQPGSDAPSRPRLHPLGPGSQHRPNAAFPPRRHRRPAASPSVKEQRETGPGPEPPPDPRRQAGRSGQRGCRPRSQTVHTEDPKEARLSPPRQRESAPQHPFPSIRMPRPATPRPYGSEPIREAAQDRAPPGNQRDSPARLLPPLRRRKPHERAGTAGHRRTQGRHVHEQLVGLPPRVTAAPRENRRARWPHLGGPRTQHPKGQRIGRARRASRFQQTRSRPKAGLEPTQRDRATRRQPGATLGPWDQARRASTPRLTPWVAAAPSCRPTGS